MATSAILGGTTVVLGAFGAHALDGLVTPERLAAFQTGVRYQGLHAVAMLAVSMGPAELWRSCTVGHACIAWAIGAAVFSGSLYALALTGIDALGAVTPIGGVALIIGWAALGKAALRRLDPPATE